MLATRKRDDMDQYDWHLCTVARINDRKRMRVSVECFDDEPREPLYLTKEHWRIKALPQPKVASRAGSASDKLVLEGKTQAAQDHFGKVRLEEEELQNSSHFKTLGVLQAGDGDPAGAAKHRVTFSWSRHRELKRILTDARLL